MSYDQRLDELKNAPIGSKDIDRLTAAERYMQGVLDLDLVHCAMPCFAPIADEVVDRLSPVQRYQFAALHLSYQAEKRAEDMLITKAVRLYENESQRLLGSIFPLEHHFWNAFYGRQDGHQNKVLIILDALYHASHNTSRIHYQLLLQSLKFILIAVYKPADDKMVKLEQARRLLLDTPAPLLKEWIDEYMMQIAVS